MGMQSLFRYDPHHSQLCAPDCLPGFLLSITHLILATSSPVVSNPPAPLLTNPAQSPAYALPPNP